jgi:hypothetical protein
VRAQPPMCRQGICRATLRRVEMRARRGEGARFQHHRPDTAKSEATSRHESRVRWREMGLPAARSCPRLCERREHSTSSDAESAYRVEAHSSSQAANLQLSTSALDSIEPSTVLTKISPSSPPLRAALREHQRHTQESHTRGTHSA